MSTEMFVLMLLSTLALNASVEVKEGKQLLGSEPTASNESFCNVKLIKEYGYETTTYPEKMSLDACPQVKNSCCKEVSQINMMTDMKMAEQAVEGTFTEIKNVYESLFNQLTRGTIYARRMSKYFMKKPMSNCKVLA